MPKAMPPGRRGGTKELISGTDSRAIQRSRHQHDERAVRVLDRRREITRRSRCVLENRHIRPGGMTLMFGGLVRYERSQVGIQNNFVFTKNFARDCQFFLVYDE